MARSSKRLEAWAAIVVVAVGGLLTLFVALPMYMKSTATQWHPDPAKAPSTPLAEPTRPLAEAVQRSRQLVRAAMAEQNLPGLSVAVGVNGDLAWAEGFGWANVESRVPVTPATRFHIGDASTVLTSAAAGLLLEQGKMKLDEEIQAYVPEFPRKDWPLTLRQVMAHTAGIRSDGGDEGPLFSQHCERPAEAFPQFADRELRFEPGTEYRYSNYGWIVVSAAIERTSGRPFLTFMQEQVFQPLGMSQTAAGNKQEDPQPTTTYFPRYGADPRYGLHLMREIDLSCYAGAMVFLSTPSDLVRFGLAVNNGKLLKPATVKLLQTSQRLPSGELTGYGLGWDLENVSLNGRTTQVAGHDGHLLGGMTTSLLTVRELGLVVAITSNISYADTFTLATKVAEAFASQPVSPPPTR